MKIKYYTLLTIIFLSTFCSCSDNLNTNPTDQISGNVIFKDVEGGMVAMNGVYRMMYSSGWAGDNSTHAFGYMSTMLVSGVMGDDMIVSSSVKGWFSMDYNLQERNFYSSTLYRPYSEWNFYYTLISNLNYIIAHENDLYGLPADKANLFGQSICFACYVLFSFNSNCINKPIKGTNNLWEFQYTRPLLHLLLRENQEVP